MKIKNIIAIDERTTRVLGEKPENLRDLLESKLHTKITMKGVDTRFKNFKFIRSTELIYVMFKKGVIKNPNKELLDAMLHSARSKGCAISTEEIKEIKNIGY